MAGKHEGGKAGTEHPCGRDVGAGEARFDISIFPAWCKDCGICAEFCPKGVFDRGSLGNPVVGRPEACNGCQECVLHCPDFAVQVRRKRRKGEAR